MKKRRVLLVMGLLVAVLLTGSAVTLAAGHEQPDEEQMQAMMAAMVQDMLLEDRSPYDFAETVERFEAAVADAGWSVVGVQDMQAILAGHGHDVLPLSVFSLCSSKYSAELLQYDDERIVSPFMPCRVSIYEKSNGYTYVARMNSLMVAQPFGGVIADVMTVAAEETEEIIANTLQ